MYLKALSAAKVAELPEEIIHSYLGLASTYAALNEAHKIRALINTLKIYIRNKKLHRFKILINLIQDETIQPSECLYLPSIRSSVLLKKSGYNQAYEYARKKAFFSSFTGI